MDFFIRSLTKKNDSKIDKSVEEKGNYTSQSPWTKADFDYDTLGLPIDKAPPLTLDCYDNGFDLKSFIIQWNLKYNDKPFTNEQLTSQLKSIDDLKTLLKDLPVIEAVTTPTKLQKWYKIYGQDAVNDITLEELHWCNDITLFRYLRSYNYKVDKAFNMLKRTLSWRRYRNPSNIEPNTVKPALNKGMIYRRGYDKRGSPLVYFRPKDESLADLEIQVLGIFYSLERACQTTRLLEGNDKVFAILDLRGWSLSKLPSMDLVTETVHALSEYYTDSLHEVLLVDPPIFMDAIIQMLKCVIDHSTSKKIVTKHRGSKLNDYLRDRIPMIFLESSLGGDCNEPFNEEVYWESEQLQYEEFQERRKRWLNSYTHEPDKH